MGAEGPGRLRFGRASRLRTGRDFRQVRESGQRLVQGCLILNWLRLSLGQPSRLGVVTSGKIGGAVVRNRARRLMRECFRLHQRELGSAVDLVMVARQSIAGKSLADVEKDFLTVMRKAGLLKLEQESR